MVGFELQVLAMDNESSMDAEIKMREREKCGIHLEVGP